MEALRSETHRPRLSLASPVETVVSFDIAPGPLTRRDAGAVLLRLARAEMAQGELAAACRVLRRAMAVEPRNIVARIELADCLVDRRRFVESSRVVETAFLLARSRGEAIGSAACLNRLVVLEVRRGKMVEARQLLQQMIRTELDACGAISALTMVNLSRVMRGVWSLQRRWRMLRGGLRIAKGKERVEALRQNGRLFIEGEDMDGALRAFEEARRVAVRIKSPPGRMASVLSDQGLALVRAGRYAAAIGVLRSASQLHAQVGNHRWAWKLARLSQRVLNARQRVDEIAEAN